MEEESWGWDKLPFVITRFLVKSLQRISQLLSRLFNKISSADSIILKNEVIHTKTKIQFGVFLHHFGHSINWILCQLVAEFKSKLEIYSKKEDFLYSVVIDMLFNHIEEVVHRAEWIIKVEVSRCVTSHCHAAIFFSIEIGFVTFWGLVPVWVFGTTLSVGDGCVELKILHTPS